jgi:Asp-tRNA(Asn)/Glu-tRNA(Gln) amidotransferase C subunit
MAKHALTKASILGMAQVIGLDISEQRAIELQPHLQRLLNLAKENERLDLSTTEPDFRFDPERM